MNIRANLYHHVLIQVGMMRILNVIKSSRWVQTQPRENRNININTEQHQESVKISGRCKTISAGFLYTVEQPKLNARNCSQVCWPYKHQLMLLSDSLTSRKMGHAEMVDKCYREYARLPKDETVQCLKFHIKNVNIK